MRFVILFNTIRRSALIALAGNRVAMRSLYCTPKAQYHYIKSPAFRVDILWAWYVDSLVDLSWFQTYERSTVSNQTTFLPEVDRISTSLKEYQAQIDVCMGGRVAEAISKLMYLF
jgi:hypothetical protein